MKRSLAILVTFVFATSAQAVQPSFMDYVPLETGDASAGASRSESVHHEAPKPSFIDHVQIESDGKRESGTSLAGPRPSFTDYPERHG